MLRGRRRRPSWDEIGDEPEGGCVLSTRDGPVRVFYPDSRQEIDTCSERVFTDLLYDSSLSRQPQQGESRVTGSSQHLLVPCGDIDRPETSLITLIRSSGFLQWSHSVIRVRVSVG